MSCGQLCPLEQISFSAISSGPIEPTEILWRWLVDPVNIKRLKVDCRSLLNRKELFDGLGLSVWRVAHSSKEMISDIARQKFVGTDKIFRGIVCISVSEVREQRYQDHRAFCVIDDTQCDQDNNHHAAHGGIRVCIENKLDDEGREQVFKDLVNLVKQADRKQLWY